MIFRNTLKGDIVNWDSAEFMLQNMVMINVPKNEVCQPLQPGHVFFPHGEDFNSAVSVCKKMRSEMTVVDDQDLQHKLSKVFQKSTYVSCSKREFNLSP